MMIEHSHFFRHQLNSIKMLIHFLKPTKLHQAHITAPGDILNCCKYPKSNINSTKATNTETVILFLFHGLHMKSKKYPNDTMTMHNHNAIKHKFLVCIAVSKQCKLMRLMMQIYTCCICKSHVQCMYIFFFYKVGTRFYLCILMLKHRHWKESKHYKVLKKRLKYIKSQTRIPQIHPARTTTGF